MQELQNPWGHWFRNNRNNGQQLLADFSAAHEANETYGGIPGAAITNSDPAQLEGLAEQGLSLLEFALVLQGLCQVVAGHQCFTVLGAVDAPMDLQGLA